MDNSFINGNDYSDREAAVKKVMVGVYGWMTIALLVSALAGVMIATNVGMTQLVFGTPLYWVLPIVEVVAVIVLSARAHKMSPFAAKIWFLVYALLNGVTFGSILLVYDISSVGYAFLVTAITFAVMSAYGYLTKTDLSSIGNLFVMALFGLVIATIVNLFVRSAGFDLFLMYAGVIIFIGLIGYDTQKIKSYAYAEGRGIRNASITGALVLYLDFINIFIRLVSLMNKER